MKSSLKIIINFIVRVFVIFLHPFLVRIILFLITSITTQYILKGLKQYGNNIRIMFPITFHGLEYISIGDNFNVGSRLRIEAYSEHLGNHYTPELVIGNDVSIGYDCHIGCVNKVLIGNNVLMASKIFITDHFHGDTSSDSLKLPPNLRKVISKGSVIIEDNVWIGEGVSIMPNVTIGKNSIIGANSVITKNIPKNSVVAGNPARVIKNLN